MPSTSRTPHAWPKFPLATSSPLITRGFFEAPLGPAGAGTKSQGLIATVSRRLEAPGSCVCARIKTDGLKFPECS